ncbi:histidine kinase [Vibrio cholerae]|nr:histidine kinase [Vibrio cholerae]
MVAVVVFEFGGMRCQPLRRALCDFDRWQMNQVDILYSLLNDVVSDINHRFRSSLVLNQQKVTKKHISLSGANGRLWVSPSIGGYDVSVSGKSLENELVPTLTSYFGRGPDGYKQKNANKGFKHQPFWRTKDFQNVQAVCEMYVKTAK